jgi:serine/threonine-protein kinase
VEPVFPPGAVVAGKLHVVRKLGAGAMGTVYEVEHALTRHRRALKVLHVDASPAVVERFVREATAAARIASPHIAETLDAGRLESGQPYLLMELLEGETLETRVQREGPIPLRELAGLIQQACEGVQAAHDAGIIHRDLKPENLFVTTREGRPFLKILDFGVSKFDERRTGAPGITREGAMIGTPFYMAPEQIQGGSQVDAQTDVYALGVILYECACGARPFDAPFVEQLAVLIHLGKPLPLEQRQPALPAAFCDVVRCAMARSPAIRFGSARALAAALDPFRTVPSAAKAGGPLETTLAGEPSADPASKPVPSRSVPPLDNARPRRSHLRLAVAIAAGGLALGAVLLLLRAPSRSPAPPPAASAMGPAAVSRSDAASAMTAVVLAPLPEIVDAAPVSTVPAEPARAPRSPAASPKPSTRADKSGLAGENPFR